MTTNRLIAIAVGLGLVLAMCLCASGALLLYSTSSGSAFLRGEATPIGADPTAPPLASPLPNEATPVAIPSEAMGIVRAEEQVLEQLYLSTSPGVVNIVVSGSANSIVGEGQGSGFVWDEEGHIVTNNHVVEGASSVVVNFADNTQVPAEVIGVDQNSDIAVLRVEMPAEQLHPLAIGDSSALRVGQRVVAIGSPFGFEQTLTLGIVSGVGRTVPNERLVAPGGGGSFSLPNLVQTDAAINPGNSGGPLLDIEGRVVGINTMIFSTTPQANSGVGFAVPINKVRAVVPDLIANGVYQTPYLGLSFLPTPMTPALAQTLELSGVTTGALVTEVAPGGPSEAAGVHGATRQIELPSQPGSAVPTGGDVVVAIDGQPVNEFDNIINYLDTKRVGDVVTLRVIRDGQPLDIPVTLGARPNQ